MIFDASFETEKEISMDFDESDQELDMDPIDERTDLYPVRSVDGVVADPAGNIDLSEARDRLISERVTQTFEERKDELIGPVGPQGPQGPPGEGIKFETDETLTLSEEGILSVNTAQEPEPDNTLPITSAAVHATVGNISAILDTI